MANTTTAGIASTAIATATSTIATTDDDINVDNNHDDYDNIMESETTLTATTGV